MALFTNVRACSQLGKCVINACAQGAVRRGLKRFTAPTMMEIVRRKQKAEPLPVEKTKRSKFIEWNYSAEIFAFGKRLGEEFKVELLLQAFTHRSYIVQEELKQEQVGIENPNLALKDNAHLAKLGQAVISAEVKRFLALSLPRLPMEGVTAVHNYLLSDQTLGEISRLLGTSDMILSSDHPVETSTFATTLKAIVGALVESQSVGRANKFVRDLILTRLAEKDLNELYVVEEPVKVLTDILARDGREAPEPRLIGQSAMNEIMATYTVGMYCKKQLIGQGPGETVEMAVKMAAQDALKRLFRTTDASAPLKFNIGDEKAPANLTLDAWKSSAFQTTP